MKRYEKFKVGDKVLPTKKLLHSLSELADRMEAGGIVIRLNPTTARVKFYSGAIYNLYYTSLELKIKKGEQLLFNFMSEAT